MRLPQSLCWLSRIFARGPIVGRIVVGHQVGVVPVDRGVEPILAQAQGECEEPGQLGRQQLHFRRSSARRRRGSPEFRPPLGDGHPLIGPTSPPRPSGLPSGKWTNSTRSGAWCSASTSAPLLVAASLPALLNPRPVEQWAVPGPGPSGPVAGRRTRAGHG